MTAVWPPESSYLGPHLLRVKLPSEFRTRERLTADAAEHLVGELYRLHHWSILTRRFRIRGSEIDLAVIHPNKNQGRIIEVKLRRSTTKLDLSFVENLLAPRKLAALKRGAIALADQTQSQGLNLDWSVDLILITPEFGDKTCLVHTWVNAVEFGQ